jgi:hypothetical protein
MIVEPRETHRESRFPVGCQSCSPSFRRTCWLYSQPRHLRAKPHRQRSPPQGASTHPSRGSSSQILRITCIVEIWSLKGHDIGYYRRQFLVSHSGPCRARRQHGEVTKARLALDRFPFPQSSSAARCLAQRVKILCGFEKILRGEPWTARIVLKRGAEAKGPGGCYLGGYLESIYNMEPNRENYAQSSPHFQRPMRSCVQIL